jgi:hypothetical protein
MYRCKSTQGKKTPVQTHNTLKKKEKKPHKRQKLLLLSSHDLCDGMSDDDARFLDLLPAQARRETDFEGGLALPADLAGRGAGHDRHSFYTRDEDAIVLSLF